MDTLQDTAELDLLIESGTPPERIIAESVPELAARPPAPHKSRGWTPARSDRLKSLHKEGLSATTIAGEMSDGLWRPTRCAILGKLSRLGLLRSGPRAQHLRICKEGDRKRKKGATDANGRPMKVSVGSPPTSRIRRNFKSHADYIEDIPKVIPDLPPDQSPDAVNLMGLTASSCRWPLGDPRQPDFMFCGSTKLDGCSYCCRHQQLSMGIPHARGHERPDAAARLRRRMGNTIGLLHADGAAE